MPETKTETRARADCEPTAAPTPVPDDLIRAHSPLDPPRTYIMGARNAVAEHIAEFAGGIVADAVAEDRVQHCDDDILIVNAPDAWTLIGFLSDADPDAFTGVRKAHNAYARDHNIDAGKDMMVIDRSLILDDIDLTDA